MRNQLATQCSSKLVVLQLNWGFPPAPLTRVLCYLSVATIYLVHRRCVTLNWRYPELRISGYLMLIIPLVTVDYACCCKLIVRNSSLCMCIRSFCMHIFHLSSLLPADPCSLLPWTHKYISSSPGSFSCSQASLQRPCSLLPWVNSTSSFAQDITPQLLVPFRSLLKQSLLLSDCIL